MQQAPRALLFTALFGALPCALPANDAITKYGSGTTGTGGIAPTIWCNSTPRPGNSNFAVLVEGGLGGAPALTYFGPKRADATVSGLRLLVDLATMIPLPVVALKGSGAGKGSASVSAPLPNLSILNGVSLHFQTYVIDRGGKWFGVSATEGMTTKLRTPGMLLVAPSSKIDLPTHRVSTFGANKAPRANGIAMSPDGRYAFVAGRLASGKGAVGYDATKSTVPFVKQFSVQDTGTSPWTATVTPDGSRIYLTNQGPSSTKPKIECFRARPSALWGTPFPGGSIDPKSISAVRIEFSRDSNTGYVSSLGIGGPAAVYRFDTKPGSRTFHKQTGFTSFSGRFVWDARLSPDDSRLYVSVAPLGRLATIAVVDARTMRVIDWDPRAPGVQSIGSEVSFPKTPLGRVCWSIAVGPRHRYLYISVSGSVSGPARFVRVNVDPKSSEFRKSVVYTTGLGARDTLGNVHVSPAGDTAYLAVRSTRRLHVIDTATMRMKRILTLRVTPNEMAYR